jgi:hypothetical protein
MHRQCRPSRQAIRCPKLGFDGIRSSLPRHLKELKLVIAIFEPMIFSLGYNLPTSSNLAESTSVDAASDLIHEETVYAALRCDWAARTSASRKPRA